MNSKTRCQGGVTSKTPNPCQAVKSPTAIVLAHGRQHFPPFCHCAILVSYGNVLPTTHVYAICTPPASPFKGPRGFQHCVVLGLISYARLFRDSQGYYRPSLLSSTSQWSSCIRLAPIIVFHLAIEQQHPSDIVIIVLYFV